MKEFFIHDGQAEKGPYTFDQLKSIGLKKETLIWYEGLEQWTIAGNIPELSELFVTKATPPPLTKPNNESIAATYIHEPAELYQKEKKKKFSPYLLVIILLVGSIALWLIYQNNKNNETINTLQTQLSMQQIDKQQKEDEQKKINDAIAQKNSNYRNNWEKYIKLNNSTPSIDYTLGGISDFSVEISNETEYMIDEVDVLVEYIRKNGDVWQRSTVTYSNIAPYTKETKIAPSSVNGVRVNITIQKIVSKKMQFCYPIGSGYANDQYFCN